MPATAAYLPTAFHAGLLPDHWRRELVVPARTASNIQGQYDFLNSEHAHLAFEAEDIIAQDKLRQFERQAEQLIHNWKGRVALQAEAFQGINPHAVKQSLGTAIVFLLAQPEKISVDATPDASVFVTATYATGHTTYLEIFLEPGQAQPVEAVVNIYASDGSCAFAFGGTLPDTLAQTLHFLHKKAGLLFQI